MNVIKTEIPEVLIFEPKKFEDSRGYFFESFNQRLFEDAVGKEILFVQDNQSYSSKNVLRGLHYQSEPYAQGKLVRCIMGEVFDVAVDIRKESESYGQWVGVFLSENNNRQLWIPEGFAHGFLVKSDKAIFTYKCTNFYNPSAENTIRWDSPDLAI
ncbi:TPA: dTDP-4-dehydrorhamnose 3,5-epimerase, partial [Escherichia coli]